ncbi:23S rRNA (pseudouridine(1915)-N(3))-methyltransferase RlmH [Mesonia maritima]|uniref:Ribosomal RNA large subunit methyltransferase H n=1 Tax=Mesonia maritima TaxID=1793873 RepID=A0ABU1K9A2_9FLAO|nr:23S rRNA (pseudouridine(1915)-N(3))-methyltransferase RlmH [Mesonia maritima]MDR6301082.1 23S rRNA (pseudouridine1915-N3)-methyltransferase [Mesonia maritima]
MTIKLLAVGKTDDPKLKELTNQYVKRLKHYCKFEFEVIPDIKKSKNLDENQQKIKEGELILKKITPADILVLLDENGKNFSSEGFSKWIQKKLNTGMKQLIFVIGGPYGFSEEVYERANQKIALSQMTFSHQMVRLFFTEQLYRAFTILKNEPYHHR